MNDNIIPFQPKNDIQDKETHTAEDVLKIAQKLDFENVLVIGFTKDKVQEGTLEDSNSGEFNMITSTMSRPLALWLAKCAEAYILGAIGGPTVKDLK